MPVEQRALQVLGDAAGLTGEERREAVRLFNERVRKLAGTEVQ